MALLNICVITMHHICKGRLCTATTFSTSFWRSKKINFGVKMIRLPYPEDLCMHASPLFHHCLNAKYSSRYVGPYWCSSVYAVSTTAKGRNTSDDSLGRHEMLNISILSSTETSEDYRRLILQFGKPWSDFRGLELNGFAGWMAFTSHVHGSEEFYWNVLLLSWKVTYMRTK